MERFKDMIIDVVIREGTDATSIHWEAPSGPPLELKGNLVRLPDPDADLKDILGVFGRVLKGTGWDGIKSLAIEFDNGEVLWSD
tara:strand:+ start:337 stop:588 length:252 start_codon:yes stop_codon:yes gene_type:complete